METGEQNPPSKKESYYSHWLNQKFKEYPQSFVDFVEDKGTIEAGDSLLIETGSTGYNISTHDEFPLFGDKPTILYSNYIQRTWHFAKLLSAMDQEQIITPDEISIGAKASKILDKYADPEVKLSFLVAPTGKKLPTCESVEAVIIFTPESPEQSFEIAKFLLRRARFSRRPCTIAGSWRFPDARSGISDTTLGQQLMEVLSGLGFKKAVSNVRDFNKESLFALRQKTSFEEKGWDNFSVLLHPKLYPYLAKKGVQP